MGIPANPIVVCGSGPSLMDVPFECLGLPYAAISTAIRYTPAPKYWLLVDRVNNGHDHTAQHQLGPGGAKGLVDTSIEKVHPDTRTRFFDKKHNCTPVGRKKQTDFLGGDKNNLSHLMNRSMLFGVEWLSWRYDCLIFAGCDMQADPKQKFVSTRQARSRINSRNYAMRMEYDRWPAMLKAAIDKNILWLNWTPGSPLGKIMEDFDDWRRRHQGSRGPDWLTAGLQPAGQAG